MTCPRCAELAEYARSAMGNASRLISEDGPKTPESAMAFRSGTYEFRLDWIAKKLAEHAEEHGRVEPLGATGMAPRETGPRKPLSTYAICGACDGTGKDGLMAACSFCAGLGEVEVRDGSGSDGEKP